jgi:hypothetical protein
VKSQLDALNAKMDDVEAKAKAKDAKEEARAGRCLLASVRLQFSAFGSGATGPGAYGQSDEGRRRWNGSG